MVFALNALRPGMYYDGTLYAGIARNMAHGIGSLWSPAFFKGLFLKFYEHLPFAIWLQSWFFRLMGDSYLVERIYCIFTMLINIGLMVYLWRRSFKNSAARHLIWIPVLLWLFSPIHFSVMRDNYLENTATIFSTLAVCFLIDASFLFNKNRLVSIFFASVCVFLGVLSNGPVLLFPLSVPFWQCLICRDFEWKKAIAEIFLLLVFLILLFTTLFISVPQSWINIKEYLFTQVLPSTIGGRLGNINFTGFRRAYILYLVLKENLIYIFLALFALVFSKEIIKKFDIKKIKFNFFFFLAIAISASFPIVLLHRSQSEHLLFPSTIFYVLAFSQIITPAVVVCLEKINNKVNLIKFLSIGSIFILLITLSVSIFLVNKPRRDVDLIRDTNIIGQYVGHNKQICSLGRDFYPEQKVNFGRFYQIAIIRDDKVTYYITRKGEVPPSNNYIKIPLDTKVFDLYRKK
jgi:hypothetical protein